MQGQGASQEETTSLGEAAGYQQEGGGTEVSEDEEVQLVVAWLLVAGWEACWGQRVDVQMGVLVEVPSSSQMVVAEA